MNQYVFTYRGDSLFSITVSATDEPTGWQRMRAIRRQYFSRLRLRDWDLSRVAPLVTHAKRRTLTARGAQVRRYTSQPIRIPQVGDYENRGEQP